VPVVSRSPADDAIRLREAPQPELLDGKRLQHAARQAQSRVGKGALAPCPPYRARRNGGHTLQLMSVKQGTHKGRPYIMPIA